MSNCDIVKKLQVDLKEGAGLITTTQTKTKLQRLFNAPYGNRVQGACLAPNPRFCNS